MLDQKGSHLLYLNNHHCHHLDRHCLQFHHYHYLTIRFYLMGNYPLYRDKYHYHHRHQYYLDLHQDPCLLGNHYYLLDRFQKHLQEYLTIHHYHHPCQHYLLCRQHHYLPILICLMENDH